MVVPGGLKVLGAYGAALVGAGTADQLRAAQALLSSVPSQLVCRPGCSLMLYQAVVWRCAGSGLTTQTNSTETTQMRRGQGINQSDSTSGSL